MAVRVVALAPAVLATLEPPEPEEWMSSMVDDTNAELDSSMSEEPSYAAAAAAASSAALGGDGSQSRDEFVDASEAWETEWSHVVNGLTPVLPRAPVASSPPPPPPPSQQRVSGGAKPSKHRRGASLALVMERIADQPARRSVRPEVVASPAASSPVDASSPAARRSAHPELPQRPVTRTPTMGRATRAVSADQPQPAEPAPPQAGAQQRSRRAGTLSSLPAVEGPRSTPLIPRPPPLSPEAIAESPANASAGPAATPGSRRLLGVSSPDTASPFAKRAEAATPSMRRTQMGESFTPDMRRIREAGEWLKQAVTFNPSDPAYVPTFKKHKTKREFTSVHLLQETQAHVGSVWALEVSPNGQWVVTAGKDLKVNLYRVAPPEDGSNHVLHHEHTYDGHLGDVLCVSWAPTSSSFVTSSMDKTVRLWHTLQPAAVASRASTKERAGTVFEHNDFVTSVAFHPNNEWFVTGCFDKKLRVWSIRERSVLFWVDIATYITSIALASQGRMVICGDHEGKATFFDTEGLRWVTQIHVRSRRGRNSKGKKISGIRVMPDQEHILITSNDSRIRLFRLSDFSLVCKYKGMVNDSFQLVASPSETGDHIICGSEANVVSVWNTSKRQDGLAFSLARQKWSERKDRNRSLEFWKCSDAAVTAAVFAPAAARERLLAGGDEDAAKENPSEAAVSLIIVADETGKLCVYENRRRVRRAAGAALYRNLMSRGSMRPAGASASTASMDAAGTSSSRFMHKSVTNTGVFTRAASVGAATPSPAPQPPPAMEPVVVPSSGGRPKARLLTAKQLEEAEDESSSSSSL